MSQNSQVTSFATIRTYPAPRLAVLQNDYTVRVRPVGAGDDAWQSVPTYRVRVNMHDVTEASMAFFDFADGPVEVEVAKVGWYYMYGAEIRPLSLGLVPNVEQRRLTFTLDRPVNCSVELNGDRRHNLHLFAGDLAEVRAWDAIDADVVVEGNLNGAAMFRRQVLRDIEAARAGKPAGAMITVRVKPGYHYIEDCVMDLPSHTTFIFDGGAVMEGAFRVNHAEDVHLLGRGITNLASFNRFSGVCGLTIGFSKHVTLDGMMFINPPHYTVMFGSSQDVTVRNVKSFSCEGWSDGLDMMACSNVRISSCFLRTSDDCVAIYCSRWEYRGSVADVEVRDCTLWPDVAHPTVIGTHGDHEHGGGNTIQRILFENIDVLEHDEHQPNYMGVMAINPGDGNAVSDVTYRNIRIERFRRGRVIDFRVCFNKDYNPIPGDSIRHVRVENVTVNGAENELPSQIIGYSPEHTVEDVTISGFVRNGRMCRTMEEAGIVVGDCTQSVSIC